MATQDEFRRLLERSAQDRLEAFRRLGPQLRDPILSDSLRQELDRLQDESLDQLSERPLPADGGISQLLGLGPETAASMGDAQFRWEAPDYDENVTSERLFGAADLYYVYQLERAGVFTVVAKLRELFRSGEIRLSTGTGAYRLYQYDRREVLRFTQKDRYKAYSRVFGYTGESLTGKTGPNAEFHKLLVHFIKEVARFFRDKRVSEVVRPRANDPSYGSVSVVRRAGLDLRSNVKEATYGHILVLRTELLQILNEAFLILQAPDVQGIYGVSTPWDVIEEVYRRHFKGTPVNVSQRNGMARAGREILTWLSLPFIQDRQRDVFEAALADIGDAAEEWLSSARALSGKTTPPTRPARPAPRARKPENGLGNGEYF